MTNELVASSRAADQPPNLPAPTEHGEGGPPSRILATQPSHSHPKMFSRSRRPAAQTPRANRARPCRAEVGCSLVVKVGCSLVVKVSLCRRNLWGVLPCRAEVRPGPGDRETGNFRQGNRDCQTRRQGMLDQGTLDQQKPGNITHCDGPYRRRPAPPAAHTGTLAGGLTGL